jgi:shikimate kinase
LLDGDPEATLRAMATDREELYREVATATIDVANRSPAEVADAIESEVLDD